MKTSFITFIICIVAWAMPVTSTALHTDMRATADSLRGELRNVHTPADSLAIFNNIFDVESRYKTSEVGDTIYNLAVKAGDASTALDILRNTANRVTGSDSTLSALMDKALSWPESDMRRETTTFISMMRVINRVMYGSEEQRDAHMKEIIAEMNSGKALDSYDQINLLYGICRYLGSRPNSEMLNQYMDSLGTMVRRLPSTAFSLRNLYYLHAAQVYDESDPRRVHEAVKQMLENLENLQEYYHSKGRIFRDYSQTRYIIYDQILSMHDSGILSEAEIEDAYRQIKGLVDSDPELKAEFQRYPTPEISYALYHKDFAKAKGLLLGINEEQLQHRDLHNIIIAAAKTDDRDVILHFAPIYIKYLREKLDSKNTAAYQDLEMAYAIYDSRDNLSKENQAKAERINRLQGWGIAISVIGIVALVVLAVFLWRQYRKNHKLARSLTESNDKLKAEGESLRLSREELIRARNQAEKANNLKTDFIKNMSYEVKAPLQAITEYAHLIADSAEADGDKHLASFADTLDTNAEALSTIVNDVLRLSDIESSPMAVHPQLVNLKVLCTNIISAMARKAQPGVKMMLSPECRELEVLTDPALIQQILGSLLSNAVKFTAEGEITLSYREYKTSGTEHGRPKSKDYVDFTVTDTGIGVDPKDKERIFERFVKLNPETQGAGLGLTIARLIAERLGGSLVLDTDYAGPGARFTLTIPQK